VSDQSPWGTPPPNNNPYGSPAQPTPPPTPPYGQPAAGGGWGGGGSPYGGSPYGQPPQPPRKKKTGLIVGIVAAVVLVVAAFVVTLVVAGGDDDDPEETRSSESQSTSSEPTETESSEPTETESSTPTETESTETEDPDPSGEGTITGDGYTFELPAAGWTDQTDEAGALGGPTLDTVIVLGRSIDLAQSNILVEALSAGGASSIDDLEGLWKRNLSGSDGATPEDIDGTTIDGEEAIGVRIADRVNAAGVEITQVAYLVLHADKQYSIALTFPASGDAVSEDDFEAVLGSWTWTS
jgi:hypothetical protein